MFGESYKLTKQIMENNEAMKRYKQLGQDLGVSFEELIKTLYNSNMELIELIKECDIEEYMKK